MYRRARIKAMAGASANSAPYSCSLPPETTPRPPPPPSPPGDPPVPTRPSSSKSAKRTPVTSSPPVSKGPPVAPSISSHPSSSNVTTTPPSPGSTPKTSCYCPASTLKPSGSAPAPTSKPLLSSAGLLRQPEGTASWKPNADFEEENQHIQASTNFILDLQGDEVEAACQPWRLSRYGKN